MINMKIGYNYANIRDGITITYDKSEMKDVLILLHKCGVSLYGARCSVCGKKIYWRKLGGVWKGKDGPVFLCDGASCILLGLLDKGIEEERNGD